MVEYVYCLRCGRKLKTDEAKRIGYGPICYEKAKEKKGQKLFIIKENMSCEKNT